MWAAQSAASGGARQSLVRVSVSSFRFPLSRHQRLDQRHELRQVVLHRVPDAAEVDAKVLVDQPVT